MKTLILLPTYNEAENLPQLLERIWENLPTADVLVIDDHSPDGTGKWADALAQKNDKISVLNRPRKMGLGSAYLEGFRHALKNGYEAVIQMDSDFSHDPARLPRLLEKLADSDVVVGSRYIPGGGIQGWPAHRLFLSGFANVYARLVLGSNALRDWTGGFRCLRRRVLESLDLDGIFSEGYAFQIELNYRCLRRGFKVSEIAIVFADRTRGKSKLSFNVILEAVFIVWKLRFLRDRL